MTLPPVNVCQGQFLSIALPDYTSNTVTVQDQDDSEDWTDISLNADQDGALLFSDGIKWWVVVDNYS